MDVYLVRMDCYDIDSTRTDIIGVFDTEEKANAFKKNREDVDMQYQLRLEACQNCPLLSDLDDYIEMCDDHNLTAQESVILERVKEFRKNSDCACDVNGLVDDEGNVYYVHCSSYERLYWACQETYSYRVIRMELQ